MVGLIPAHAGKTSSAAISTVIPTAHPRSRGENLPLKRRACRSAGSSPLTRGKQGHAPCLRDISGLIPAHAGKTT